MKLNISRLSRSIYSSLALVRDIKYILRNKFSTVTTVVLFTLLHW